MKKAKGGVMRGGVMSLMSLGILKCGEGFKNEIGEYGFKREYGFKMRGGDNS